MPGGWGRKAVGQIDRNQLADDELLKQIGGQLDGNFDYSQWQRKSKPSAPTTGEATKPSRRPHRTIQDSFHDFTVRSGSASRQHGHTVSALSTCSHSRTRRDRGDQTRDDHVMVKERSEDLKILQLRVRTREHTLKEYKKRCDTLLLENMKLKRQIDTEEGDANSEVKQLLRKYEKFRKGIGVLNSKFEVDVHEATDDLELTEDRMKKNLTVLESDVAAADKRLQDKQQEFHVLMNYKDKEYPVKAMRIADLQKELESLKITNAEDETELQHIIDTELGKLRRKTDVYQEEVTDKITAQFLQQMHPSLRDMTQQNTVMQKEVEYHQSEIIEVDKIVQQLEEEVAKMLQSPKTNAKLQIFPEFFPKAEKCTPDMEVVLDIPTQEWLPI